MKARCRFCGTIITINIRKKNLQELIEGPPTGCPGNQETLSPKHCEHVSTWGEHYEILDAE
tara:strand:+ start:337 stop:519 length:183 start_codon:yes stop_codon:yes gene_type:complete